MREEGGGGERERERERESESEEKEGGRRVSLGYERAVSFPNAKTACSLSFVRFEVMFLKLPERWSCGHFARVHPPRCQGG
jgi:hypothetical protein